MTHKNPYTIYRRARGCRDRVKSQSEYEQEGELRELYREAFDRGECGFEETVTALVVSIIFRREIARQKVNKWKSENKVYMHESDGAKKKRKKRQESLEKKFLKRRKLTEDEINTFKSRYQNI
jgi:hypothetical protein